jgi:serine/threonine-protein kinase
MSDRFVLEGDTVVLDRETGFMWQRAASGDRMVWKDGFAYVDQLNRGNFAGFGDWRYPTKDEMATLIQPQEERRTGLYVSPLFGGERNCWTSTEGGHHRACYVDFYYGDVYLIEENYANHFVRAVRTA